ncbi:MAG: hypothetical protein NWT08_04280 [Akkermansiaceae bacterium]|jgi:ankyrin repeat protein|nr:hypothetical protein [Akkermansiaceae bacterium]MDP4646095.1 hypothetical protein [Akkermansiaceae bacterium]MDP4720894.1 hypothetical protein [Akkermansiaceae bacterium]MDP4780747.1 hypothetical protein [Akkermansiaceae bacterium]MDP4845693.1 hypothetical protein [Akkermansiaceae bacterium]
MKRLHPLLLCFPLLFANAHAGEAEDALLKAATEGDAPRIVLALAEADPDIRGKDGQTPLMLAAASSGQGQMLASRTTLARSPAIFSMSGVRPSRRFLSSSARTLSVKNTAACRSQ